MIDWCCFYYFVSNSLVALLETLYAKDRQQRERERARKREGTQYVYRAWERGRDACLCMTLFSLAQTYAHHIYTNIFIYRITQSVSTRHVMGSKKIPRACGLVNYLFTVSRCGSWHLRLHSCFVWVNNLAVGFRPLLETRYKKKDTYFDVWHEFV